VGHFLCIVSLRWFVFFLLVVLVKLPLLASDSVEKFLRGNLNVVWDRLHKDQAEAVIFLVYCIVSLFNCVLILSPGPI